MERSVLKRKIGLDARKYLAADDMHSYFRYKRNPPPEIVDMIAARGTGAYFYTQDGVRYLDYLLGYASLLVGHSHPAVVKAIAEQLKNGLNFSVMHELMLELAKDMNENIPCADKVQFVASGSEATSLALRLARAYTGKEKVMKFEGAYHGWHDQLFFNTYCRVGRDPNTSVAHVTSIEPGPDSNGIPKAMADSLIVAPYNDTDTTIKLIRKHKGELAAVIVEPLMRGIESDPGFLEAIRETTEHLGIPMVLDEVITGFRLAYGGAQEYYGVTPDLATYSKALGGGLPLGAVAGKDEIMSLLRPDADESKIVYVAGYGYGNTLAYAASISTLNQMKKPGMYERLNGYGDKLREELRDIFERNGFDCQMTGAGSNVEYFFMKEKLSDYRHAMKSDLKLKDELWHRMLKKGIFCLPGRYFGSTAHGQEEFEQTLSVVEASMKEIKGTQGI